MFLKNYWPFEPVPLVWGIEGALGGGKTLSAVGAIIDGMGRGFFVVSNVTLREDFCNSFFGNEDWKQLYHKVSDPISEDPFLWPRGSLRGSGGSRRVVVVLDECAEWFSKDESCRNNAALARLASWLRHTSKMGMDVIFIVQQAAMLNKDLRRLVFRWCRVQDMLTWRLKPFGIPAPPFMHHLVFRSFYDPLNGLKTAPSSFMSKKFIGKFYDTSESLSVHDVQGSERVFYTPVRLNTGFPLLSLWRGICFAGAAQALVSLYTIFRDFLGI